MSCIIGIYFYNFTLDFVELCTINNFNLFYVLKFCSKIFFQLVLTIETMFEIDIQNDIARLCLMEIWYKLPYKSASRIVLFLMVIFFFSQGEILKMPFGKNMSAASGNYSLCTLLWFLTSITVLVGREYSSLTL